MHFPVADSDLSASFFTLPFSLKKISAGRERRNEQEGGRDPRQGTRAVKRARRKEEMEGGILRGAESVDAWDTHLK